MKKSHFALLGAILTLFSCSKSGDTIVTADAYMSLTANSTWNYRTTDNVASTTNNYTTTSTNRDSVINGNSYHVFTNSSTGGSEYYRIAGNGYYTYRVLTLGTISQALEALYLKDNVAVGSTWNQTVNLTVPGIPLPVPVTTTYTIAATGGTRTVNGTAYSNVIQVTTAITSSLIPAANLTTNIQSYYAPRVGLIENTNVVNLNYMGVVQNSDTKTILLSADIK